MSKIDDLIKELCPNGVVYKNLGSFCDIKTGAGVTKKDIVENGKYKIISGGVLPMGMCDKTNRKGNTVTIARAGTAGFVNFIEDDFYLNDKCFSIIPKEENLIENKYLYYSLSNIQNRIYELKSSGTVPTVNTKKVSKIVVPIPPIEIQEEIVRILDKFSDNGLEKLLLTELELRKQQYEYYLNLAFKNVKGKRISLGSIVNFQRGKRVVKKDLESNKNVNLFPVYQNSLIPLGYYDKFNFDDNKTIIISAGAAGKIGFVEEKIWAADDCLRCFCSNEILDKFLYYFLKSNENYIQSMVRRASVPRISSSVFGKMLITLPSIDEQKKIIEVFDRFEKIINSVNDGLPCEIELRRKQYEYYRNKLLSFEELSINE